MIDDKHLAIVRAALTFWDEEMASADQSIYRHYFHSKDLQRRISPSDVAELRRYFNDVDVKFAVIDKTSSNFISSRPIGTAPELTDQTDQQLVVVLVPIA